MTDDGLVDQVLDHLAAEPRCRPRVRPARPPKRSIQLPAGRQITKARKLHREVVNSPYRRAMMSRPARLWRTDRSTVLTILAIAAAIAVAAALIWPITDLIAAHDVGHIAGPLPAARLQTAREAVRSQLLTLAAGVFVAATLWFTAQNYRLARQGQVTDRYTKAVEQIGSDKLDVRIGGIYALERIARDSARDHPPVMAVLTAFVREHSHEPWPTAHPGETPAGKPRRRPDI